MYVVKGKGVAEDEALSEQLFGNPLKQFISIHYRILFVDMYIRLSLQ